MFVCMLLAAMAVTNVSTVAELHALSKSVKGGTKIVLADGMYDLSTLTPDKSGTYLPFARPVALVSSSGDAAKCVLKGGGEEKPGRALSFADGENRLEGIGISDFAATGDCGAYRAKGKAEVSRCRFVRCRALDGAGGVTTRQTLTDCVIEECSCKGRGGAGGGGAVAHGRLVDCTVRRCSSAGYGVLRNGSAVRCAFEACEGPVGYMERFEDCTFRRCGGLVSSTLVNCGIFDGHYATTGVQNLLSLCTATNCTITGTTGGNPKQWNSGIVSGGELVNCVIADNHSVRDIVRFPAYQAKMNTRIVNTVVTNALPKADGRTAVLGFDPKAGAAKRAVEKSAREEKLAREAKSGVHEIMRIDFDNDKPRHDGGAYGGFWTGVWGDSKCEFSLVPGEGGKGQAMRCNLRGMVGGQLQVFSGPWTMWQNSWYRLRFKARGVDHPGFVSVGVRKCGYPWSMLAWPSRSFQPTNEWREYTIVKKSQHDVSDGFGILLGLGDVGIVDFDYFIVEKLDYDPTECDVVNTNPSVRGNLVPRGSFETKEDGFLVFSSNSNGIWPVWREPWMERAEGGKVGRYCLWFPPCPETPKEEIAYAKMTRSRTLGTVGIPVASGRTYKLSVWYKFKGKVAYCGFWANAGKSWSMGKRFCLTKPGEWQKLEIVSDKPVPQSVRSVNLSIEINAPEVWLDGLDFRMVDDDAKPDPAEKPYELQLAFDAGKPAKRVPPIVTWGEGIPLEIAAMPKDGAAADKVPVTLKCVAYPDRVTVTKRLTLVGGEPQRMTIDPQVNGLVRFELAADKPAQAEDVELVAARLPKPRKTGPESYFGTHLRMCPYFVDYAAAIGIKWQRLHDCSNMCKMKWANPRRGEYQWADEIVDYVRAKGLNILALPDYPSAYAMPTNAQGQVVYDNEAYRVWCRELAAHYAGRIDHFEIWNEPYMPYFYKRDAKEFGKTFNAGAAGIREGNPAAKVVGWCTEFTTPKYVLPFMRDYPVEKKPDCNSVHYYYTSVPGDGDLSYDRIIGGLKATFGEYAGGEIWNTEGNLALTHTFHAKNRRFDRAAADRGVAFGTRGWAETIACGISKTFLYTTHNTDTAGVGGFQTLIDYDRAPTPEAAATAVTAYFIDGLKSAKGLPALDGCKYQAFVGGGRAVALVWDDVLQAGRPRLAPSKDMAVFDAMGNRLKHPVELGAIPVFAVMRGEDAAALVAALQERIAQAK